MTSFWRHFTKTSIIFKMVRDIAVISSFSDFSPYFRVYIGSFSIFYILRHYDVILASFTKILIISKTVRDFAVLGSFLDFLRHFTKTSIISKMVRDIAVLSSFLDFLPYCRVYISSFSIFYMLRHYDVILASFYKNLYYLENRKR